MARALAVLMLALSGCAAKQHTVPTPAEREYYRTHPAAECRKLQAEKRAEAEHRASYLMLIGNTESGLALRKQLMVEAADPCVVGCRLPACGFAAVPEDPTELPPPPQPAAAEAQSAAPAAATVSNRR